MRITLLALLTIFSFHSFCQNKALDSLKNELLRHPEKDSMRVKFLVGVSFYSYDSPEDTKRYAEEALQLANELHYEKGKGGALSNLVIYYWEKSDYKRAIELAFKALSAYENAVSARGIYQSYNNISGLYIASHDYDKGIEYLNKALAMGEQNKSFVDYGNLYNNLGNTYAYKKDFNKAIEYFNRSLKARVENKDIYGQSIAYHGLGQAFYNSNDSKSAMPYFEKSLEFAQQMNAPPVVLSCLIYLAKIHIENDHFAVAKNQLEMAEQIVEKTKSRTSRQELYDTYSSLYEKQRNFQKAMEYFRKKTLVTDSIFNASNAREIADTESRYNAEKKEQEILLLNQEQKIQILWRNILVVGTLLIILASTLIFLLQRSRMRKDKLLLEAQTKINQQLIEVDKIKSRFFANISHEFRTPLTLILSPVEEKLGETDLSQKDKISFQSIRRSANRLLELINQLLEQAKLESGSMKLDPKPGKLSDFIPPILSAFDSLADVNQVQFHKEIRINEFIVLFDADKLEKILNNLLSNAFKFSPKHAKVDIKVLTAEKEKFVDLYIELKNSGTLIPTNELEKIFDPFFQSSTSIQSLPGTGLGLSLVKEFVSLHAGEISVSSNETDGTAFIVSLQFEKSSMEIFRTEYSKTIYTAHNMEPIETTKGSGDPAKDTILIVDDNKEVRALIRNGVGIHYNILEASTGKEGVDITHNQQTDLVISDVMMPVMNGVELCHILKNDERTSHVPVILLTARADHESKLEGLRTGADDYLIKPFNMSELLARIENIITQRKKLIQKYHQRVVVHPHEITVTPLDERFIQKAIQVIENNLDNVNLSVDTMAEELGMSRANLHRKFKSITGMATNEFLQDFRLRRAAILMEKKADSIAQIAYQVGFNDQSYFTKCFKKKFGKTPSEFMGAAVVTQYP